MNQQKESRICHGSADEDNDQVQDAKQADEEARQQEVNVKRLPSAARTGKTAKAKCIKHNKPRAKSINATEKNDNTLPP